MDEIKSDFLSNQNTDMVINLVIKNIKNKKDIIIKNNEFFFDVYKKVITSIIKNISINDLAELNFIVIEELTKHIIKNIDLFEIEKRAIPHDKIKESILSSSRDTVIRLPITGEKGLVNIDNVKNIKILSMDIYNSDYIINEYNNVFSFREILNSNTSKPLYSECQTIVLDVGDYSPDELVVELDKCINVHTTSEIKLCINKINNKISFTADTMFDMLQCDNSILNILGFTKSTCNKNHYISDFPHRLNKKSILDMNIYLNKSTHLFSECIFFGKEFHSVKEFNERLVKKFDRNGISVDSIDLDFGNYNFRGYTVTLIIELTYIDYN